MSYLMNGVVLDEYAESVVRNYLDGRKVQCVDIEDLITSYLGLTIVYETIAEEDLGKIGFISDGQTPIWISQRGEMVQKVYPESTVVIDQYLQQENEKTRKRFTLAHEAGHYLMDCVQTRKQASGFYHTFEPEKNYSQQELARQFSFAETNADKLGAALLMPYFLVKQALEVWNKGKPIVVYGSGLMSYESRMQVRGMAYRLGVSYTALMIRLKWFGMIEYRDMNVFVQEEIKGRGYVK